MKNPCDKCHHKYNRTMIRNKDGKLVSIYWCAQQDKPCKEIKDECGKFVDWVEAWDHPEMNRTREFK